ncbi:4-(cytidine 5'-diphospho)-2-C-methyl-D-erythritol kinase [Pseudoclavibacter chungangensis]|uniref:4-diphosphocytidyl-2-C-methyl-D-erythritol kinase n=1 Tax=Pseudoclavibacter chungangensis TaxID=587635 RepID=A0A7J5BVU5_9MICO|nr:4-(cytidine 5'-diphospho)-2-C-methyl-D-erythritol kinase [Pseudoclavibacter chungangensis]KAB1657983.1 4-(cytidine 5'-diphospho)-2-C-methyl-D-erythritol kinase [Pseudoclavibacter chungangensis]NYJ65861.1 4-diphosphocytidyl-2-C-methyl-D-erythritol kinase [Pseudoclavibacter chungangensis]
MTATIPLQHRVVARAPAKINVSLEVGTVHRDGSRQLATAFQAISLFDEVEAIDADEFSVTFDGPVDARPLASDDENLAIRAAGLLAERAGHDGAAALHITKHVPVAGGMAGGSADAAATLVALDALWGTGLAKEELLELGAQLGTDVPFALMGGTAVGTGRGEELSPALSTGTFHWVVVTTPNGSSSADAFRALDEERDAGDLPFEPVTPRVADDVLQALRRGDAHALAGALHNDLQEPALRLRPELRDVLELGERAGALAGILSGSGPSVAFLAAHKTGAIDLQVALTASQLDVVRVTGPVPGARVLEVSEP